MASINTSEQVVRLAQVTNALANGTMQRAMSTLGWLSPAERGRLCKQAGMSPGQFTEWLDGRWCPPTDQLLVVLQVSLDHWSRQVLGAPAAVSNGRAS